MGSALARGALDDVRARGHGRRAGCPFLRLGSTTTPSTPIWSERIPGDASELQPRRPARPRRQESRSSPEATPASASTPPGSSPRTARRWCSPAATPLPPRRPPPKMPGSTRVEQLDLASQASVRAFAARWAGPLDLLVNNAGVMRPAALPGDRGRPRADVRHQPPRPLRAHRAAAARAARPRRPRGWSRWPRSPTTAARQGAGREPPRGLPARAVLRQQQAGQPAVRPRAAPAGDRRPAASSSPPRRTPVSSATEPGRRPERDGREHADPPAGRPYVMPLLFQSAAARGEPDAVRRDAGRAGHLHRPQRFRRDPRTGSGRPG